MDVLNLLIEPDAAVVTDSFARRRGLSIGSRFDLALGDRVKRFAVRGILRNDGPAKVMDGNFVLLDIAAAQLAFDRLAVWTVSMFVWPIRQRSIAPRKPSARACLPAWRFSARPAAARRSSRCWRRFSSTSGALSQVALLVGLFLIYNTVATSVIARREEIGVLRALGTSRGTILALFLGEAATLAAIGCALGVPLGWLLAWGAVGLTSSTVTTLYVADAAQVPSLTWWQAMAAFGVGLPLALAAATAPALEAARVSPLDALQSTQAIAAASRPRRSSLLIAAVCLGRRGVCRQAGRRRASDLRFHGRARDRVRPGVPGAVGLLSSEPICEIAGARLRHRGRLAHANLAGAIPRLCVSVAALAVSLAMLVAIAVMIGSFRETVIYWVAQTLQADLYIATARRSNLDSQATISRRARSRPSPRPRCGGVDRFRALTLPFRDRLIVAGLAISRVLLHGTLVFKAPRDGREASVARPSVATRWSSPRAVAAFRRLGRGTASRCRRQGRIGRFLVSRRLLRLLDRPRRGRAWTARPSRATSATCAPTSLTVYLQTRRERRRRARPPDGPDLGRSAPACSSTRTRRCAPRCCASSTHLRDHVWPGSDRHPRRDAWGHGHAGDAHPRTPPRTGARCAWSAPTSGRSGA